MPLHLEIVDTHIQVESLRERERERKLECNQEPNELKQTYPRYFESSQARWFLKKRFLSSFKIESVRAATKSVQ
jgi:hypothetical protein